MSDLIDLNSPDTDKVLRRKLASPLIPPPARTEKDDLTSNTNGLPNLMSGKICYLNFFNKYLNNQINLLLIKLE